ncbi:MAG: hypothetical protein ABW120_00735 [Sedimenticola sp.]
MSEKILNSYPVLLLLYVGLIQLLLPITVGDTDMWYHLHDGDYMRQIGEIPSTYYYSFATNGDPWVDHFWLFQLIISHVYEGFGYYGLLVLRSALLMLCIVFSYKIFFRQKLPPVNMLLLCAVFALFVILVEARGFQLRPHLFSYLFIALFIYLLEYRPDRVWLLPLFTVLWINLHGIEWVIAGLIAGAYFAEALISKKYPGMQATLRQNWQLFVLVLCLPALLLNPFGLDLVFAPFGIPGDYKKYILEMQPINSIHLYAFSFRGLAIDVDKIFGLLLWLQLVAIACLLYKRKLRLSHLIMSLGGIYLLLNGRRFIWEWVLLAAPLFTVFIRTIDIKYLADRAIYRAFTLVLVLIMVVPFHQLWGGLPDPQRYPVNQDKLPLGMVEFLKKTGAEGNLVMAPSLAGYIHWSLYPQIKIHSDMKGRSREFYELASFFRNQNAFEAFQEKYDVDFISVNLANTKFPEFFGEEARFKPVFTDDSQVLYANIERQPEIVSAYQMEVVDPFTFVFEDEEWDRAVVEIKRIESIHPEGNRINHKLARMFFKADKYEEALLYARRFELNHSRDPNSSYWVGNVLENLEDCEGAIAAYQRSYERADEDFRKKLLRQTGACHYLNEEFDEAYEAFSESVNPYTTSEHSEDLYQFAFSALIVGEIDEARKLLNQAYLVTGEDQADLRENIKNLLDKIDSGEFQSLGIMSWLKSLLS